MHITQHWRIYFNSQPHKEADTVYKTDGFVSDISTHSLTRRLTRRSRHQERKHTISTHSLTRRLTLMTMIILREALFQLTASQGG